MNEALLGWLCETLGKFSRYFKPASPQLLAASRLECKVNAEVRTRVDLFHLLVLSVAPASQGSCLLVRVIGEHRHQPFLPCSIVSPAFAASAQTSVP